MTTTTKTAEERTSHVKPDNFILVQGWMLTELGLKGNDLLTYAIIHGFSQDGESCFHGSLQYLADWTGSTKKGVQKNLKNLVAKGLITKAEKVVNGVKYCEYRTTDRKTGGYGTEFPGMELSSPGMELSSPGMELSSPGMELSSPNNIDNNKANNKKESTGTYEPDDDDLPFKTDVSDKERIQQGLVQVANEWNRITKTLKGEGIQASSLVLSRTEETSDRTRKLRLAVRDYGADVIIKCLKAYERDDWWTGRTIKPQYAGKARNIEYVLDNFGKLLRLADEMGLIEAADAAGGLRYRPTEQSADVSPDQTQQTRQPRSRALRNRR